jgi:hypothetical protein
MKARNALPLVLIAIASVGAYLSTTPHAELSHHAAAAVSHAHHGHEHAAVVAHHGDHDAVALHDITLHGLRHFGDAEPHAESLRTWPEWTPDWELRWIALVHDGRAEGVYHLTSRHQPHVRYTVTAGAEAASEWEPAR